MPIINGYGYSEYTALKQEHFAGLVKMHIGITCSIIKRYAWVNRHYHYLDLNAGPGIFEGKDGSPLIFLRTAKSTGIDYHAVLIEKEKEWYNHLVKNTEPYEYAKVIHGDHNDIIPYYFGTGNKNKYGLLYSDQSGGRPPFELLAKVAKDYQRLDQLIYVSAANIKRVRCCSRTYLNDTLLDGIKKVGKKKWIVREPVSYHQWTFFLGSNWIDLPAWRRAGFHDIESPRGKEILVELNLTKKERTDRFPQLSYKRKFGTFPKQLNLFEPYPQRA